MATINKLGSSLHRLANSILVLSVLYGVFVLDKEYAKKVTLLEYKIEILERTVKQHERALIIEEHEYND